MCIFLLYLFLSDALVLKILAPNHGVLRGNLHELKEIFAGREHLMNDIASICINATLVCSFFVLIFIARPRALFGSPQKRQSGILTVEIELTRLIPPELPAKFFSTIL